LSKNSQTCIPKTKPCSTCRKTCPWAKTRRKHVPRRTKRIPRTNRPKTPTSLLRSSGQSPRDEFAGSVSFAKTASSGSQSFGSRPKRSTRTDAAQAG
jgi:hypothetical protein